jgi:beta-glucosidase
VTHSSAEASAAAASAAAAAAKQRAQAQAAAQAAAMAASAAKPPAHSKDAVWHKGVAISMWQNSGDPMLSNWSQFVARKFPFGWLPVGLNRYQGPYSIHEVNPGSWDRYKEDIALVKQLGCNAYRVSIEWARVEPRRGEIDQAAVDR